LDRHKKSRRYETRWSIVEYHNISYPTTEGIDVQTVPNGLKFLDNNYRLFTPSDTPVVTGRIGGRSDLTGTLYNAPKTGIIVTNPETDYMTPPYPIIWKPTDPYS
jgi:hypothetical protein